MPNNSKTPDNPITTKHDAGVDFSQTHCSAITCFCKNANGENCPQKVKWAVNLNQDEVFLCEQCYRNAEEGAYGKRMTPLSAILLSDFLPNP